MTLLQMSLQAGLLILFTALVRALLKNRLPGWVFLGLWSLALARLLLPFRLPAFRLGNATLPTAEAAVQSFACAARINLPQTAAQVDTVFAPHTAAPFPWVRLLWLAGVLGCAMRFTFVCVRSRRALREAVPVENPEALALLARMGGKRVRLLRYDRIVSPLADGLLRPRIYLPTQMDLTDRQTLRLVLTHELYHVRRGDRFWKLLALLAVCVHWFNPAVWLLLVLFNRDLERTCDEALLRRLGPRDRAPYASSLLRFAEAAARKPAFQSQFSRIPLKERIVNIMKWKKPTRIAVGAGVLLVVMALFFLFSSEKEVDTWGKYTVLVTSEPIAVMNENERIERRTYELPDGTQYIIVVPTKEFQENHGLLINKNGETYGYTYSEVGDDGIHYAKSPDLVLATGIKQTLGYIKQSECKPPAATLEEAAHYDSSGYTVDLYLEDGETVIGSFTFGGIRRIERSGNNE